MSYCVVFILKEQLLDQNGISFRLFPSEGELQLVSMEFFYAFILGLRAGFIPGSWLSFFILVNLQCGVSSFHCFFFPVCVFIRLSYPEKVFNHLIL